MLVTSGYLWKDNPYHLPTAIKVHNDKHNTKDADFPRDASTVDYQFI